MSNTTMVKVHFVPIRQDGQCPLPDNMRIVGYHEDFYCGQIIKYFVCVEKD